MVGGTILPLQAFGLGDIIFCQTLIHSFNADRVIWGVEPQFIDGLQWAYPGIEWIDYRLLGVDYNRHDSYMHGGAKVLPIRFADQILKLPYTECMRAKYSMYGVDWRTWKALAMPILQRERQIQPPKGDYVLVNKHFGSSSQFRAEIELETDLPIVYMETLPGHSLFDWCEIIQNAKYIFTASTSILYLLEILPLQAKEVHLFARKPIEPHFRNVSYLFTKDYILHS